MNVGFASPPALIKSSVSTVSGTLVLVMKPVDLCSSKTNLKITHFHKYYVVIVTSSKRIPFVYREQFLQAEKKSGITLKQNVTPMVVLLLLLFILNFQVSCSCLLSWDYRPVLPRLAYVVWGMEEKTSEANTRPTH